MLVYRFVLSPVKEYTLHGLLTRVRCCHFAVKSQIPETLWARTCDGDDHDIIMRSRVKVRWGRINVTCDCPAKSRLYFARISHLAVIWVRVIRVGAIGTRNYSIYLIDQSRSQNLKPHLQLIKGIDIVLTVQTCYTLVLKDNLICACFIHVNTWLSMW